MIIIKHDNFPDNGANLIRYFESRITGESVLVFPEQFFGEKVQPGEWMNRIPKVAKDHRPVILTLDDGIAGNSISRARMKTCGCVFVSLARAWADQPWNAFAWRIIKVWPEIVEAVASAHAEGRECRLDVSLKGKISRFNL